MAPSLPKLLCAPPPLSRSALGLLVERRPREEVAQPKGVSGSAGHGGSLLRRHHQDSGRLDLREVSQPFLQASLPRPPWWPRRAGGRRCPVPARGQAEARHRPAGLPTPGPSTTRTLAPPGIHTPCLCHLMRPCPPPPQAPCARGASRPGPSFAPWALGPHAGQADSGLLFPLPLPGGRHFPPRAGPRGAADGRAYSWERAQGPEAPGASDGARGV